MAKNDVQQSLQISFERSQDLSKCIICQKAKDNKGSDKLTSTEKGRRIVIDCSVLLKDDILEGIQENEYEQIKYHVNTCYSRYKRLKERTEIKVDIVEEETAESTSSLDNQNENRPKRRKLSMCTPPAEKPCIVCNHIKSKGDNRRFRICEVTRAHLFLSAIKFNKDDVYTRCILFENFGDVYAADVMYHKNCLSNYLRKFEREIDNILSPPLDASEKIEIATLLEEFLSTINIKNKATSLSEFRDLFNTYLIKQGIEGKMGFTNY